MQSLRAIAALILVLLVKQTSGQTFAPQSMPNPPVLRTNTNLVLLDVGATGHGNAAHGLVQQQFRIYEDGVEQTITAFDEHRTASDPAVPAKPTVLPPNVYSNVPVYAETSAVNMLLLDGLNTPASDQDPAEPV
jgi:hypothetical protein